MISAVTLFWGCSREKLSSPDDDLGAWQLGDANTYDVPATPNVTVEDAATQSVFRFAQGGGRITVTQVLSGPGLQSEDGGIQVDYVGPSAVEYVMTHVPESYEFLLGFETHENMMVAGDEPQSSSWLPLVDTSLDTTLLVFPLPVGATGNLLAPQWSGVTAFKPLRVPKGSTRGLLMADYETNLRQAANALINAIPPAHRTRVMAEMNGPLSPKLYVDINTGAWFKTEPKYVPFWDYTGLVPRCAIVLTDDTPGSIPHEVGHYFHHVLVGSSVYSGFSRNTRGSGHAIGTPGAKENLIEEPAYFAEYYLKGTVSGRNPEGGAFVAAGPGVINSPDVVDFPDLEGFATSLFASVTRESGAILDYKSRRVPVPVVTGVRDSSFHACYQIIAEGTSDIYSARDKLETYLARSGQADKLPAMLQPLGWTYRVDCRFVDNEGRPVSNLSARPISRAGAAEFSLPLAAGTSDAEGRIQFDTFYPGTSALRVYDNGDSVDVTSGIHVPWTTPTTQVFDLGDVVVTPDRLLEALHRRTQVYAVFEGRMTFDDGQGTYTGDERVYGSNAGTSSPISWSGNSFSYSSSSSTQDPCDGTITATLSVSGSLNERDRTMSAAVSYRATDTRGRYEDSWDFQITDLPISSSTRPPYANTIRFVKSGPDASRYLSGISARIWHSCSGYMPGNYVSTDWGNTENAPRLLIEFFSD